MTPEEKRKSTTKSLSKRRKRLKEDGLCQDCGADQAQVLRTLCTGCLKDRRAREAARYAKKNVDNAQETAY